MKFYISDKIYKVGVFDSGVGGLSIAKALKQQLAGCEVYYYCDNLRYPYGPKTESAVNAAVISAYRDWASNVQLDVLIVACNTASTIALPALRSLSKTPVVGVVPAIKPAAEIRNSKILALLATPGTISRDYTKSLIEQYAQGKPVKMVGSSRLVDLAEEKLRGIPVDPAELKEILSPLLAESETRPDVVVLGCTHFPLLHEEISSILGSGVRLIDSTQAIVARTAQLINAREVCAEEMNEEPATVFANFRFSANTPFAVELAPYLKELTFQSITYGS